MQKPQYFSYAETNFTVFFCLYFTCLPAEGSLCLHYLFHKIIISPNIRTGLSHTHKHPCFLLLIVITYMTLSSEILVLLYFTFRNATYSIFLFHVPPSFIYCSVLLYIGMSREAHLSMVLIVHENLVSWDAGGRLPLRQALCTAKQWCDYDGETDCTHCRSCDAHQTFMKFGDGLSLHIVLYVNFLASYIPQNWDIYEV